MIIVGEGKSKKITQNPTVVDIKKANSVHVLAFTSHGDLLVNESEGDFSFEDWEEIHDEAERICCGSEAAADEDVMRDEGEEDGGMMQFVKSALEEKVEADMHWRG